MRSKALNFTHLNLTLALIILITFSLGMGEHNTSKLDLLKSASTSNIHFIENEGQFDSNIAFLKRTSFAKVLIDKEGEISYIFSHDQTAIKVKETPLGRNKIQVTGISPSITKLNFIKAKGTKNEFLNVGNFSALSYGEIFSGIEMYIRSIDQSIEKVFLVKPGANPSLIQFGLSGMEDICINDQNELQLDLEREHLMFSKPVAWQNINNLIIPVSISYKLWSPDSYGFEIQEYNDQYPLFIDPMISSTYQGGNDYDMIKKVIIGKDGDIYVGGITRSIDFGTTINAYDTTFNDSTDVFIAKYDPKLEVLKACTYIGGSDHDVLNDMKLDGDDNIYFGGKTNSKNYPVSDDAYDNDLNAADTDSLYADMFISCLSNDLSQLLHSTYLGSEQDDWARGIALDSNNNVLIVGYSALGIPAIGGPFMNPDINGDFVVAKMDKNLRQLKATNSLSANNALVANSIIVDSANHIFIAGDTYATDLMTTVDCLNEENSGNRDVFVVRINDKLNQVVASTYLGGEQMDYSYGLITDENNHAYICGQTNSSDFPVTETAFDNSIDSIIPFTNDAYISRLDSTLGKLIGSTYIGGTGDDAGLAMVLDSNGHILLTGFTESPNFPVFCNSAINEIQNIDGFISKFGPLLDTLIASTFFGGINEDKCLDIDHNAGDTLYVAGITASDDFAEVTSCYNAYNGDPYDGFILSIDPELDSGYPCCAPLVYPANESTDQPRDLTLSWSPSRDATGYLLFVGNHLNEWNLVDSLNVGTSTSYDLADLSCGDSIYVRIIPYRGDSLRTDCDIFWFRIHDDSFEQEEIEICEGDTYFWQGENYSESGSYEMEFTDSFGCDSIHNLELTVHPSYYSFDTAVICDNESFSWQGEFLDTSGSYTNHLQTLNGCDSIFELELTVHPSYEEIEYATICEGESHMWEGLSLSLPGVYSNHWVTDEGCDSTLILDLHVDESYSYFDTLLICQDDSIEWYGNIYSEAGAYQISFSTQHGCDSTYNLYLNYYPTYSYSDTLNICDGDSIQWQGNYYSSSGDYHVSYPTIEGCDSSFILHLEVSPIYNIYDSLVMCLGDTLEWEGITLTESGEYMVPYTTVKACDSTLFLNLTVIQPDTSIWASEDTLFTVGNAESYYQWVHCPDYTPIDGANLYYYIPDSSGTYAVTVENNGCVDTSACVDIILSRIHAIKEEKSFMIYPNPVNDAQAFLLTQGFNQGQLEIYDKSGICVSTADLEGFKTELNLSTLPSGVYLIVVRHNNWIKIKRLVLLENR